MDKNCLVIYLEKDVFYKIDNELIKGVKEVLELTKVMSWK